jgi:hypothetical protein
MQKKDKDKDYPSLNPLAIDVHQPSLIQPGDPPLKIRVSGCTMRNINGTYVVEKANRRNSKRCFSKIDGPGALYFDGTFWKLCQAGNGRDEVGWNFSQLPDSANEEDLPPPAWVRGRNMDRESDVDYTGLRLEVIAAAPVASPQRVSLKKEKTAPLSRPNSQSQRRGPLTPPYP